MTELGLMLPDEAANASPDETVRYARQAEDAGFHSLWKGEASWGNGLVTLGAVARETEEILLGPGVANVFSRTPSLLAMSAASLDLFSDGRAVLGLGVSSPPVVERWHGMAFERPLRRLRETIEIIRQSYEPGPLEYEGEIFDVGPFGVGFDTDGGVPPIYNAAMGETNCRLTGEFADGWLPAFIPLSELEAAASHVEAGARAADRDPGAITTAPMVGAAVDEDPDRAERYVREFIAQEMGVGYNRLAAEYGFGEAADEAHDLFRAGDREAAAAAISEEMLDEMAIYGTPETCREQVERYGAAGSDVVVLFPPYSAPPDVVEQTIAAFE